MSRTVWRTWVAAMRISPDLGVARLAVTPISSAASARASSVWGSHTVHHNGACCVRL